MPSPFPGMDPYLENPGLWGDVHAHLIIGLGDALAGRLRPKYLVRVEDRVYVSDEDDLNRREYIPDVRVVSNSGPELPGGANGARIEVAEPIVAPTVIADEIRERHLKIIDRESRQVVTVIEVVSPTNKLAGSSGLRSFKEKRREVLDSTTHWVEIDLIRRGVPIWVGRRLPPHQYLIHVSKAERRPNGLVWPIRLDQHLPAIPIPLKAEDSDAPLDLQALLDAAYDRAGYDLDIDYRKDPVPPLEGEWDEWADRLLKEKGLRPGSD